MCQKVLPYVHEMKIDNEGKHKITNFKSKRNSTEADHAPMWMKVNLKITPERPSKETILNFRDKTAQLKVKEITSTTKDFSNCFKSNLSLKTQINQWKHVLDKHCRISFPVIRIRKKFLKPSPADKLIDKRNLLLRNNPDIILEEVKELNVKIASIIALEQ